MMGLGGAARLSKGGCRVFGLDKQLSAELAAYAMSVPEGLMLCLL